MQLIPDNYLPRSDFPQDLIRSDCSSLSCPLTPLLFFHRGLSLWLMAAHTLPVDSAPSAETTSYSCCREQMLNSTGPDFQALTPPCIPLPSQNGAGSVICSRMTGKRLQARRCEREQESCSSTRSKLKQYWWVSHCFIYSHWARIKKGNARWTQARAGAACGTVALPWSALFIHSRFYSKAVTKCQLLDHKTC